MSIKTLMLEYNFEIDDIRWYLSVVTAEKLLSCKDNIDDLIKMIWSGSLQDELYNFEERYLDDLEDRMERGLTDEIQVRDLFGQIGMIKTKRDKT